MKRKLQALIFAILCVLAVVAGWVAGSQAESEEDLERVWVLCDPKSDVNIRYRASGRSEVMGRAECGDAFYTDGKSSRGFLHVYAPTETGEGWISKGYIVTEQPEPVFETKHIESQGRVACRVCIEGDRKKWLKNGEAITVYWIAEWAVTDRGFVNSDYIGD